jgi:hypothetical protein
MSQQPIVVAPGFMAVHLSPGTHVIHAWVSLDLLYTLGLAAAVALLLVLSFVSLPGFRAEQ